MSILAQSSRKAQRTSPTDEYKETCPHCYQLVKAEDITHHALEEHNLARCKKCNDFYRLDWIPEHEKNHCPADLPFCTLSLPMFSPPPRGGPQNQLPPSGSTTNSASKSLYSKSKTLRKNENSNTLKLNYAKTINALVLILEQRRKRIMNSLESAIYIARRTASAYLSPATSSTAPGIPKISVIQKP